uniref:Uncharacterized protein n=1 Tax=Trypanosoma vivax (strain Y486) TaxID=1055687 RepID=G0TSE6_TRYVY|nr:conserved hypothetical protein, fragment [Trypanosoma vivax Y486]
MVEPHLFCGPLFTLEVPEGTNLPLEHNALLQLQTDLYNLLTPTVRRVVHADRNYCSAVGAPPPPDRLLFVEVAPTSGNASAVDDSSGTGSVLELPLLISDSRAASELFVIGLRNPFAALSNGMRLRNRYESKTANGGKPRSAPGEILRKKEALRLRMNLDEDLWDALQEALTPQWMRELEDQYQLHVAQQQQQQGGRGNPGAPMRDTHRHEQLVECLLYYCEQNVRYVGMLNDEGKASPFLLAMGAFEELEPFFAPSLTDEVVVACAEDLQVTSSMRQLCEDLLLRDEVCEAWPPTLHAYWIEHIVSPMMQRVEAEIKRKEEMRLARERDSNVTLACKTGQSGDVPTVRGTGSGVGVFGFRNIRDLHAYVREKQRVLIPQRILSMVTDYERRDVGRDGADDDGDANDDNDDDDDFLIKVQVEGVDGESATEALQRNMERQHGTSELHKRQTALSERKRKRQESMSTRELVVTGAYRTVLRLLGRSEPFDRRSEHFISF